jgi:hypothetical protein
VTSILSEMFGSGAASSEVTALCVYVYVIVFVAPAAIVTLPLSALACASGSVNVEVSTHDRRAVQRSPRLTVDPFADGATVPTTGIPETIGVGTLCGQVSDGRALLDGCRCATLHGMLA